MRFSRSGIPGTATLEVRRVGVASAVTSLGSTQPMKLLAPVSRGPSVWAYTSSLGGGYVAGDETRLEVRVGPGARCYVGSQSSTKIYRGPARRACRHSTRAEVEAGALLALVPDPVQPFAGSTFRQDQQFDLDPSAGLVLAEIVGAGRTARTERWAFDHYESRNVVRVGGVPRFVDAMRLSPADGPLEAPHRLGRFECVAFLVLIGPPVEAAARALLADIGNRRIERRERRDAADLGGDGRPAGRGDRVPRASVILGGSPIAGGAILRLAGERLEAVSRAVRECLGFLPPLLGDDPWARKW